MAKKERHEKLSAAQVNRIRQHLDEVLASSAFIGSKRSRALLQLLVDEALAGRFDNLHERAIGVRMYGRAPGYDTANDAIVRVNVTEVRKRLSQFYRELETRPVVRIELPSGTYIPKFCFQTASEAAQSASKMPEVIEELRSLETLPVLPGHEEKRAPAVESSAPAEAGRAGPVLQKRKKILLRWAPAVAAALAAVACGAVWFAVRRPVAERPTHEAPPPTVLVLPFENLSGDRAQDYFADGITDELIADLGQVPGLRTISQTSAMSFKRTHKTLPEIARELSVQWVVEGSVLHEGKRVRVTAELIDAATDHSVWSTSFTRGIGDALKAQAELALAVAEKIQVEVGPKTRERFGQLRPVKDEAQQAYLQGTMMLQESTANADSRQAINIRAAMKLFERAIELDPSFAQPHAALAEGYSRLAECGAISPGKAYAQQKAEALRAIELNPSLAEGHAELAGATIDLDYDWAAARAEFRKALDLNPGSVSIRLRYALFLVKTGSPDAAVAEAELCRRLDPLSERLFLEAEYIYFYHHKYDQVEALDRDGVARNILRRSNNLLLGRIDLQRGQTGKAIKELQMTSFPASIGQLGVAYARTGQMAAASQTIHRLQQILEASGSGAYDIALIYAAMGNRDEAFRWLDKGFELHDRGVTYVKIDPSLDSLRQDLRFTAVLKRAGFAA